MPEGGDGARRDTPSLAARFRLRQDQTLVGEGAVGGIQPFRDQVPDRIRLGWVDRSERQP